MTSAWIGLVFLHTVSNFFPYGMHAYNFESEANCWQFWDMTFEQKDQYPNFYHSKYTIKRYYDKDLGDVWVTCVDKFGEK